MLDEGVHQDNVATMLKQWSQTIEKDFYLRNFAYLPGKRVVAMIGELDAAQPADGSSDEAKEMLEYFRADWRPLIHYYNFMCKRTLSVQQLLYDVRKNQQAMIVAIGELKQNTMEYLKQIIYEQQRQSEMMERLLMVPSQRRRVTGIDTTPTPMGTAPWSPLAPSAAALVTPGTITEDLSTETMEERPCLAPMLPDNLKDTDVVDNFVYWHTKRWYSVVSNKDTRHTYKAVRDAYACLSFFLRDQVPVCPPGLSPRDRGTEQWANQIRFLAKEAFEHYKEWRKIHVITTKPPAMALSPFFKEVYEVDSSLWPPGPDGVSPFPAQDGESERERLINNQQNRAKVRATKAAKAAAAEVPAASLATE
jgi:hypothetical protein